MSWLFDKVPEEFIGAADQVEYTEQIHSEVKLDGALLPSERLDRMSEVSALLAEPRLTMEVREGIAACIFKGMFPEVAAARHGVNTVTFNKWLEYGTKGLEPYATFLNELIRMEAMGEERTHDRLMDDPANDRFILERRYSRPTLAEKASVGGARWRKQQASEIEVNHTIDFENMSPAKKRSILAQLAEQNKPKALPPGPPVGMEILDSPPTENVVNVKP